MAEQLEWRSCEAAPDAGSHPRYPALRNRACGGLRDSEGRQPHQCDGADRRAAGRAVLFHRRSLHGRHLPDCGETPRRQPRRLRLYVEPRAGRPAHHLDAGQPFRPQPRTGRNISCWRAASASRRSSRWLWPLRGEADFRVLYACRSRRRHGAGGRIAGAHRRPAADVRRRGRGAGWISTPRSPGWRPAASFMSAVPSACWRRPSGLAASGRPVEQLRFETFGNSGRFASQPFKVNIPRLNLVDAMFRKTRPCWTPWKRPASP